MIPDVGGLFGKVRHIFPDVPMLYSPLQSRAYHGMMLNHRVGAEALFDFKRIIVLQITRRQLADGDLFCVKIRLDVLGQNVVILVISSDSDIGPVGFQPLSDVLGQ